MLDRLVSCVRRTHGTPYSRFEAIITMMTMMMILMLMLMLMFKEHKRDSWSCW